MTCDQRVTLNGVVVDGADVDATYKILRPGISGLGAPDTASGSDLNVAAEHGSVTGADYTGPRTLRIPMAVHVPEEPELAMDAFRDLQTAWAPAAADQRLDVKIPGYGPVDGTVSFFGRPRGSLDPRLQNLNAGVVFCQGTFVALDPIGYGPEETESGSGTVIVTNIGDVASRRATVTLTGNDGTPKVVNVNDGGTFVEFGATLAGAATWAVDLLAKTVIDGAGSDVYAAADVLSSSTWPRLVPGSNSLVITGAASASVTYRDGYW
jgi:hypothetical protein